MAYRLFLHILFSKNTGAEAFLGTEAVNRNPAAVELVYLADNSALAVYRNVGKNRKPVAFDFGVKNLEKRAVDH